MQFFQNFAKRPSRLQFSTKRRPFSFYTKSTTTSKQKSRTEIQVANGCACDVYPLGTWIFHVGLVVRGCVRISHKYYEPTAAVARKATGKTTVVVVGRTRGAYGLIIVL